MLYLCINLKKQQMDFSNKEEITNRIREIIVDFYAIESGYSDRQQFIEWKSELSVMLFALADNWERKTSFDKIKLENQKYVVRNQAFATLKQKIEDGEMERQSDTNLRELAKGGEEHQEWVEEYAKAYSKWSALREYTKTVQSVMYSIGGHLKLQTEAEDAE